MYHFESIFWHSFQDGKTQDLLWLVNVIGQWNHLLHIQLQWNGDWLGKNTPRQHYMKTVPSEYNNRITVKTEFRIKIVNFQMYYYVGSLVQDLEKSYKQGFECTLVL